MSHNAGICRVGLSCAILPQARQVFMKQRWLGVAAMQQPFDFLAIADIIYEVQPDIIIETGELKRTCGQALGMAAWPTVMVPTWCFHHLQQS